VENRQSRQVAGRLLAKQKTAERQLVRSCPSRAEVSTGIRDSHSRSRTAQWLGCQRFEQCLMQWCRRQGCQGRNSIQDKQEVDSSAVHQSRCYQEDSSKDCRMSRYMESHKPVEPWTWERLGQEQVIGRQLELLVARDRCEQDASDHHSQSPSGKCEGSCHRS
jgi:hypothetical protein